MPNSYSSRWRTPSTSGPANNCIQVRNDLGAVRDSKDPSGRFILTPSFSQFVHCVTKSEAQQPEAPV
jgi:Domain of unknown function (DUF397)